MRKIRRLLKPVEKFEARQFREAGVSIKDCASYFDVSVATLCRGLAELREKLGPEKLPANRRHLARSHVAKSQDLTSNTEKNAA